MSVKYSFILSTLLLLFGSSYCLAGAVEKHTIKSKALEHSLIGVASERNVYVYLPDGYQQGKKSYPIIYYVANLDQPINAELTAVLDDAIAKGELPPCIFVSADFSLTPGFNFFGNNEVVGHWLDFIHHDLRNWVESNYRVKRGAKHRAISGHFLGAYAAIKLAMFYPETYGSVYGLHPVATEYGDRPFLFKPNWEEVHSAKSAAELKQPYSAAFVSMAQAYLPNTNKPPFYADFIVEKVNGELVPAVANIRKLKQTFHLADLTPEYAENLLKLRGIGMDWGRNDQNWGHVIGARRYSVLLENFGIPHDAEEHLGNGWDYQFRLNGKVRTRMLPFLGKYLEP
ncbi:esterase family protein [Saccharophagus degradans]|uniref:alpha/beta hydrolase n=1 Tax=Saccharophagus degradans TaxID=86304 RepID=UPI001C0A3C5F|nr:alpha/beta hydrolase-fold protein [Saccharophagus degradans]MBU2985397.1 esterase family protein [Saccharophagus degradans]